jgi:hypothetical protein
MNLDPPYTYLHSYAVRDSGYTAWDVGMKTNDGMGTNRKQSLMPKFEIFSRNFPGRELGKGL